MRPWNFRSRRTLSRIRRALTRKSCCNASRKQCRGETGVRAKPNGGWRTKLPLNLCFDQVNCMQCHPEFLSKPHQPHPLFKGFIAAAHTHIHQKPL
jgi:hypothetical protein